MLVVHKNTGKIFEVYDTTYKSKTGRPSFLIYDNGQWLRMAAKYFKPCEKVGVVNDACTCNTL